MNPKILIIHCTYSDDDRSLIDILRASFQTYLQKELRTFAITTQNGV